MLGTRFEWPRLAAFVLAGAFALAVAQSVYRIPLQVSDSLEAILISRHPTSSLSLLQQASQWSPTTLRPMRYLQARWLGEMAETLGLSYHVVFRGVHAAIAVALFAIFAWVANARRWSDVAALGFAMTVLVGLHTFDAMMREAFPVNHYAEIAAASLFVLGIALRPARRLTELLALVFLVGGLLLIESAVLIWVAIVACAALRMPGIRTRTAVSATLVIVLFMAGRAWLGIGSPGIGGHSSGWGGVRLEADELAAMFASNPWPFYLYNVVGGALSLAVSEPRFGVYQLLTPTQSGMVSPVVFVNMASSLIVTAAIIACCRSALRTPFRAWTNEQKILAVGTVMVGVSAALCVTYIKDDILSTAGVFYAAMSYISVRWLLERVDVSRRTLQAAAAALCLVLGAPLWAFRAVGTHYELRRVAFTTRNDWALQSPRALAGGESASLEDLALVARVRAEALRQKVTSPSFLPDWGDRYWIE